MSNVPFPIQPATYERVGGSTELLQNVASGSGAYAAWVSLGTMSRNCDAFVLYIRADGTAAARGFTSIALGAGADANMIAKDIWTPSSFYVDVSAFYLPVRIGAGQEVFAKCSRVGAVTPQVGLVGISGGLSVPSGFSRVEGLVANIATSLPFAHATTVGADTWIEALASASNSYRALLIAQAFNDATVDAYRTRVGVGAGGSEVSIAGDILGAKNQNWAFGGHGWRPCRIAAGDRVAISCRTNAAVVSNVYTQILGLVA